ncbi:MAG: translation initiation factor IF-3 [Bacteroidota bacterium]|nr:translation initiation factor IF-3 [Bacteroidota bacterium]
MALPKKKPTKPANRPRRGRREPLHKINQFIAAPMVRVVGDNVQAQVLSIQDALILAKELELDLVEISPNIDPPVCKIVDYNKFLYEQKKKMKEQKATAINNDIKEIRFGPNTDEHDVDFKLKHATKFLGEGAKVRAYVFFKGRTIVFKERGEELLMRFANKLIEDGVAKLESPPKQEGKKMIILLVPGKKK